MKTTIENYFKRVVHPGLVKLPWRKPRVPVFCKVEIKDGELSISGVEGPDRHGSAAGGCGQIDMGYRHDDPTMNDSRYTELLDICDYAPGWDAAKWQRFLGIWKRWHLNAMQPACEHQRALGWTYEDHHDTETYKGEACPVCGYSIGSQWLKEELPQDVVDFLFSLPETTKTPAWV